MVGLVEAAVGRAEQVADWALLVRVMMVVILQQILIEQVAVVAVPVLLDKMLQVVKLGMVVVHNPLVLLGLLSLALVVAEVRVGLVR
jgi:hypothetical protein